MPFLCFPPYQKPPYPIPPCFCDSVSPLTHPLLPPTLDSPTLGHLLSLHRTKDLCSHWCLPRLYMQLELCVLLGWWLSPWELWGIWLVDIVVLPMGLQTPSAPSVLSLTPPLGTPCSVQWLAVSICLCICKALAGPLRRQLYQAPFSKHFLASTIVSGFGDYIWDESVSGTVSALHFVFIFFPWVFCSPF